MAHPFMSLAPRQRNGFFLITLFATLATFWIMNIMDKPLYTEQASSGIVSFELAGTPAHSQAILNSWDERAKLFAAFGLGFDYLFMLSYSSAIGLGCLLAAGSVLSLGWPLSTLGSLLAWGMWLAALFDGVENLGLAQILFSGSAVSAWPAISRFCALAKFSLLLIGLGYLGYGLIGAMLRRVKHT
jgi:hypothetical protein